MGETYSPITPDPTTKTFDDMLGGSRRSCGERTEEGLRTTMIDPIMLLVGRARLESPYPL